MHQDISAKMMCAETRDEINHISAELVHEAIYGITRSKNTGGDMCVFVQIRGGVHSTPKDIRRAAMNRLRVMGYTVKYKTAHPQYIFVQCRAAKIQCVPNPDRPVIPAISTPAANISSISSIPFKKSNSLGIFDPFTPKSNLSNPSKITPVDPGPTDWSTVKLHLD